MQKLLLLALITIVFVSGCIDWGGGSLAGFGLTETTENPDIYLKIESSASEIKSGRNLQLQCTITNKGGVSLNNVVVRAYDQCLFTGNNTKIINEIKPNRTSLWNWRWESGNTDFERDCEIRFRTEYNATAITSSTVNVLTESEYYARESQNTLDEIKSTSILTDSALKITLTWSEDQPFLEDEDVFAYINYDDVGHGMIRQLEKGSVVVKVPENLAEAECSSFEKVEDEFILNSPLKFVNKRAPSTTCKFKTNATQPIESGEFRITANYKYQFDNSLLLKVTPK